MSENEKVLKDDFDVPKSELEKVWWLLKGREGIHLQIPHNGPKHKYCNSRRKIHKRGPQTKQTNFQEKG